MEPVRNCHNCRFRSEHVSGPHCGPCSAQSELIPGAGDCTRPGWTPVQEEFQVPVEDLKKLAEHYGVVVDDEPRLEILRGLAANFVVPDEYEDEEAQQPKTRPESLRVLDAMASDYGCRDEDEQVPVSEGGSRKFDSGKPPMGLLPRHSLEQVASVLGFGAQKYDAHNWRKGMKWSRLIDAALRHIHALNDGEDHDPESGMSHAAHAACCLLFLIQYQKDHPEMDDRYQG